MRLCQCLRRWLRSKAVAPLTICNRVSTSLSIQLHNMHTVGMLLCYGCTARQSYLVTGPCFMPCAAGVGGTTLNRLGMTAAELGSKLVSTGSDGCAALMGHESGVQVQLQRSLAPFMQSIWCHAHRGKWLPRPSVTSAWWQLQQVWSRTCKQSSIRHEQLAAAFTDADIKHLQRYTAETLLPGGSVSCPHCSECGSCGQACCCTSRLTLSHHRTRSYAQQTSSWVLQSCCQCCAAKGLSSSSASAVMPALLASRRQSTTWSCTACASVRRQQGRRQAAAQPVGSGRGRQQAGDSESEVCIRVQVVSCKRLKRQARWQCH